MATLLLGVIYLTFISLGLPDALLGAAWPAMRDALGLPLDAAGALTILITGGTVVSSLLSERLTGRFGAARVTAFSVAATAAALLGFSFAPALPWLMVCCVPLGLGAGAVDAALNNYVALHYAARHMSWLHCFWGLGAFLGPTVMSAFLRGGDDWRGGYQSIGFLQLGVVAVLVLALPLWMRQERAQRPPTAEGTDVNAPGGLRGAQVIRRPGVMLALTAFLLYCALEYCANLWSSSFLVEVRGLSQAAAAQGASLFFVGITVGRLLTGFLTARFAGDVLIRTGCLLCLAGGGLLFLPFAGTALVGLLLIGLGCAPIYPCMIHETPARFGAAASPKIIGWQMATAYLGTMLVPPLLGLVAGRFGIGVLPPAFVLLGAGLLVCTGAIPRRIRTSRTNQ